MAKWFEPQVGKYYYDIRFNHFNVYVYVSVSKDSATGKKVAEFCNREDAKAYVYKMNGWAK